MGSSAVAMRQRRPPPAGYWRRLEHVRVPGCDGIADLVLVGPTGVHVVMDHHETSGHPDPDPGAAAVVEWVAEAAAAVAALLPARYHLVVAPVVRLPQATGTAESVDRVLVASPDALAHTWHHGPRLLSTSEAALVGDLLEARLERLPPTEVTGTDRWRRRWLAVVAVLAAAAAAAAVAAAGFPLTP